MIDVTKVSSVEKRARQENLLRSNTIIDLSFEVKDCS